MAVQYEIALDIKTGDICWLSRPHQPGIWNALEIFCNSLLTYLDTFECVEADDGYIGEAPLRVYCPGCVTCPREKKEDDGYCKEQARDCEQKI